MDTHAAEKEQPNDLSLCLAVHNIYSKYIYKFEKREQFYCTSGTKFPRDDEKNIQDNENVDDSKNFERITSMAPEKRARERMKEQKKVPLATFCGRVMTFRYRLCLLFSFLLFSIFFLPQQ